MSVATEFEIYQEKIRHANSLMPIDSLAELSADAELIWQFVHPDKNVDSGIREKRIVEFIKSRRSDLGDGLLRAIWTTAGGSVQELDSFIII